MSWQRNYVVLPDGEQVRFALIELPESDAYYVRFKDASGRRVKKTTGHSKKPDALAEAQRIILKEFDAEPVSSEAVDWEVAKSKLRDAMETDGKRPKTIAGYIETLGKLISVFPRAEGPADISEKMAEEFKGKYDRGRFTRKRVLAEGETAPEYSRKKKSLDSRIRSLKAIFGWFKKLRVVEENPFEGVESPKMDRHEVKHVSEDDVAGFFEWIEERYPDWPMPRMFFSVKALTGCRLDDICNLKSNQLQDGRLLFTADTTKNRSERYAILPPDLYAELDAYAGKTHVWERYPPELIAANKANGFPTHRQNPEFSPQRLYLWIVQLMQAYQTATGIHLSSHDFRRAAFTRAAEANIHPKRAATAFDVTPETMMKYYTATEKKQTADEVLGELAEDLLPKRKDVERGR